MIHHMYFIFINIIKICILKKKIRLMLQINKVNKKTNFEIFIKIKKKKKLIHSYF